MSKQQKPKKLPTNRILAEQYLNAKYDFQFNVVTNKLFWRNKNTGTFVPISDFDINSLHRALLNANIKIGIGSLRNLLFSDFSKEINPFYVFFRSLPPFDNHDHIDDLASTVTTKNDVLWKRFFKKWIVAAVASLLQEKVINHSVIILIGSQGKGKTTWLLRLVPIELSEYVHSGRIDPGNKDTLILLSECFLINLDEIDSFTKNELAELKEIITKSKIRLRRPFGSVNESLIRRASFVASINNHEFLHDLTGSRRFLCFEITNINYQHSIDLRKVYAQALHLIKSGFQFWFNEKEIEELERNNQAYRVISQEEELLTYYFEPCTESNANDFLSSTDIISFLRSRSGVNLNHNSVNKLGKILRAHGFLRVKREQRYVYALKRKATVAGIVETSIRTLEEMLN